MTVVYLLYQEISDARGIGEVVGVYTDPSRAQAEQAWIRTMRTKRTWIKITLLDGSPQISDEYLKS